MENLFELINNYFGYSIGLCCIQTTQETFTNSASSCSRMSVMPLNIVASLSNLISIIFSLETEWSIQYPVCKIDEEIAWRTLWAVGGFAEPINASVVDHIGVWSHVVCRVVPDKHGCVVESHKEEGECPVPQVEAADMAPVMLPLTSSSKLLRLKQIRKHFDSMKWYTWWQSQRAHHVWDEICSNQLKTWLFWFPLI